MNHHLEGACTYIFLKLDRKAGEEDPFAEPPVICVADAGSATPEVYVNSTATSWEQLGKVLLDQLKVRPKWIVYVEAEPNVPWGYAANAGDAAKGLHANVVLLDLRNPTCR